MLSPPTNDSDRENDAMPVNQATKQEDLTDFLKNSSTLLKPSTHNLLSATLDNQLQMSQDKQSPSELSKANSRA